MDLGNNRIEQYLDGQNSNQKRTLFSKLNQTMPSQIQNFFINITYDGTGNIKSKELPKMKTFVVLRPGEDGYIIAECPTLPGCVTQGKTEEEAINNAKELIELYLEVSKEYNLDEPLKAYEVEV